jgi:hypothetical protein
MVYLEKIAVYAPLILLLVIFVGAFVSQIAPRCSSSAPVFSWPTFGMEDRTIVYG